MEQLLIVMLAIATLVNVTSAKDPILQVEPSNLHKPMSDKALVSCEADVDDKALVTDMQWKGPHGETIPYADRSVTVMQLDGPGKLDLVIQNIQQKNAGNYTCSASYTGIQLTATAVIQVYKEIDFGDTPTHQTPTIGTDATIKCTVSAIPAPQVNWLKDNTINLNNNDRYIIQQDGILIKNISTDDNGLYTCTARVSVNGAFDSREIKVEVYIPPKITGAPEDTDGLEAQQVTFQCVATGQPAPKYSWVDNNARVLAGEEGYHVDIDTGELTIFNLKPEQAGNYRCTASNPAGDATEDVNLRVLTKPKIESYVNITIETSSEAALTCIASGDPLPEITFKKKSNADSFVAGRNTDNRIFVSESTDEHGRRVSKLELDDVRREDDGLYSCEAKSDGGLTEGWGHITVEFGPTFEEQHQTAFYSWEQQPVNLTCIPSSIPNATITWFLRNKPIPSNDANLKVLSRGPTGVLQVNPSSSDYFAVYTCRAINKLNAADMDLTLKQVHVPGPLSDSRILKKTATTISWSLSEPLDNGGRPITGFLVQYRKEGTTWGQAMSKFWVKESSYLLDGLVPDTTYIFRFAARNEVGDSEFGGEKSQLMPHQKEPEEPQLFGLSTENVNPIPYTDNYELHWQVPLDNGHAINNFQVRYYKVVEKDGKYVSSGSEVTRKVIAPGPSTFKLVNLDSNTIYKIELRAENKLGYSTPAEAMFKTAADPSDSGSGREPNMQLTSTSVAPATSAPSHGTFVLSVCCCCYYCCYLLSTLLSATYAGL